MKNSKLLKRIYSNKFADEFAYDEAKKLVEKRYTMTPAIANLFDWENQKKAVLQVLDTYIKKEPQISVQKDLKDALNKDHERNFSFG